MTLFICDGRWHDNNETFQGMVVSDGDWDGIEDAKDEQIFFYTDGEPVIGDHGEFVIEHAEEWTHAKTAFARQ
jgi:hypothetical protein